MKRIEHLLVILGEEAAEVAKETAKCLRFGPEEIYPKIGITNAARIVLEINDLLAMVDMLVAEKVIPPDWRSWDLMEAKRAKVEELLLYSVKCGTLELPPERKVTANPALGAAYGRDPYSYPDAADPHYGGSRRS